jgi:hypothetical protein
MWTRHTHDDQQGSQDSSHWAKTSPNGAFRRQPVNYVAIAEASHTPYPGSPAQYLKNAENRQQYKQP